MDGENKPALDQSIGYRTLAVLIPLFVVATVVYAVRIWTRVRPKYRLNVSDHAITIAFVAELICIVLTTVAVARGFGRPAKVLSHDDLEVIGVTTFIVFIVALWASCFARISVACLLLQLTQERAWRILLWAMIGFQLAALISCDVVEMLQCRPIRAMWAKIDGSVCMTPEDVWVMAHTYISVGMVSDALFAILPIFIIWRLSRSMVEKVLLSVLMGLGILAVCAGAFKIMTLKSFVITSENIVGDMMPAFMWTRIEEIVLIIAACAPLLKAPIESMLHRHFGLPKFGPATRGLNSVHTSATPTTPSTGVRYFVESKSSKQGDVELSGANSTASGENTH